MTDDHDDNPPLGPSTYTVPDPAADPAAAAVPVPVATTDSAPVPDPGAVPDPAAFLQNAVGAPTRRRAPTPPPVADDPFDDPDRPRTPASRRTIVISAAAILVGLATAALVFLGRANAERYLITCAIDHASAEQGRNFPPWGSHALSGPEWKPIALPANAECRPRETDDPDELAHWYLDVLIDRASTALSAHDLLDTLPSPNAAVDKSAAPNALDVAQAELEQALLLARAPERRDERKEIERLQGDVSYWRAALHLRDANAALADAAKQFDAAAAQRPRHATDAAAWATFLRRVVDELHGGPAGGPTPDKFPPPPPNVAEPGRTAAPPASALPVEPSGAPPEPAAPPDAGVPSGGVLL
ncbi:MAG TPA: hypothetical protein VMJ10_05060 [Kofleriaceae bacterium]|nr:hypothetical protein [Kofleriaceae bacterium]